MATEGPATRRVRVAEHPRWGRGDDAFWDRPGRRDSQDFWLFAGGFFCSREWTESLGFSEAARLGLRERPRRKNFPPWFLPRVERFSSSMQILLFSFLLKVVHPLCWALADVPKLTLNPFFLFLACRRIVLFKVSFLKYSLKTNMQKAPNQTLQTTLPYLGFCILLNKS